MLLKIQYYHRDVGKYLFCPKILGNWVVNVFSSFLPKRLILYRKCRKKIIFNGFWDHDPFNIEIIPYNNVAIFHNTQQILWNIFHKIFHHSGPMTSSWPPKTHFFNILSNFLQIFTFLTTLTWKLSHKTRVEIVHNTLEIIPISIFSKIFRLFWPYDVILTPKMHFFDILSKILQISTFLTTSTWKLFHKTMVEIVHNTLEIIPKSIFSKIFWLFWP